ncbi:hypothetical protein WMY93_018013 [Mugilogobius chulae]|uniref:Reverse transcriptase domain-containing protein n=1 Tax=Mugilogobius chulae TaxID=88201 RepID=A0AAW0NNW3_9GOBI
MTEKIKWPKASQLNEWQRFDEDVELVLESVAKGDVDKRLQTMTTVVMTLAAERFGTEEKQVKQPYVKNNRATKIHNIRQELKALKKQYKTSQDEEKGPLEELRAMLRKRLLTLRRAEYHRRRRRERSRKRSAFITNPFQFTKQLLGQKRSGRLTCSKEQMEEHLRTTYSDPMREVDLGNCDVLITPAEPTEPLNLREPLFKEVQQIVRKARAGAAPGPSGTTYNIYKRCPCLLKRLWKILKVIWRRGKVPSQWRQANGVWIPKEENSENINQFRMISLLSVEGKIFFSILASRLTEYFLKNKYIDTSVQKGGIPGVPGCLEHTGVVSQLLREARENKGDLVVLWLDLANAYGSIPHKLVERALQAHHVPESIRKLIMDYYDSFHVRVSTGQITSDWCRLEVGIITGCTISVILFSLAMNMLVKSTEPECRGPKSRSGIRQPPIRAFMDDLTVTTESVPGARWILKGLEKVMGWARMSFKPAKSRSLVLKKGKVWEKFRFSIENILIPSITEQPIKSLGKIFDATLKDKVPIKSTCEECEQWLKTVDKTGLPGRFKAWIYQHGILPRILWPLLLYEFPISIITTMERTVSRFLRRWLGLPKSISNIALYGNTCKLKLPFKSIEEEFKVMRAREVLQYRESSDPKVAGAKVAVRTGRKWRAEEAVEEAEGRLRHKMVMGAVAKGKAGLGLLNVPRFDKAQGKERRHLIQEEIRAEAEEERKVRAITMKQQGAWTKWEQAKVRKVTWNDLWKTHPHNIKFLIGAVYDVLPSPCNLHRWGLVEKPSCLLCGRIGTLEHILSSCPRALADGRYRWRHDQVLRSVAENIYGAINNSRKEGTSKSTSFFVKEGETIKQNGTQKALLCSARDWRMEADLDKQLKFPPHIAETMLRPDIVLWSNSSKQVLMIELTVPWEERMEEANERKRDKYEELKSNCQNRGWRAKCWPVEVGCRGFVGDLRLPCTLQVHDPPRFRVIYIFPARSRSVVLYTDPSHGLASWTALMQRPELLKHDDMNDPLRDSSTGAGLEEL